MKKVIILLFVGIFLQACGLHLLDPNATTTTLPATPAPSEPANKGPFHTVSGTVVGLPLAYDLESFINTMNFTLTEDGGFTFPFTFPDGATYGVTLGTLPGGYTCNVTNGNGTIMGADVTDVLIECSCFPDGGIAGDGTASNPIEVWDAAQLDGVATNADSSVRDLNYVQMCDISYLGVSPTPIGTGGNPFTGTYDGQGFFISDYTSSVTDADASGRKGLFGYANNATLTNINLQNFDLTPSVAMNNGDHSSGAMGTLAGYVHNTDINNVFAQDMTINANSVALECVGGLVGVFSGQANVNDTPISNFESVHVSSVQVHADYSNFVGGIIGGSVNEHANLQDIVGEVVTVSGCYARCGGVIGNYYTLNLPSNVGFSRVQMESTTVVGSGHVGGLAGTFGGNMIQASFEGSVENTGLQSNTTTKYAGGLFGDVYAGGSFSNNVGVANVFTGSTLNDAALHYGHDHGTNTFAHSSNLSGTVCQNCSVNPSIGVQADINAYYTGTDAAISAGALAWDFANHWCLRSANMPTLQNVPFSNCN